MPLGLSLPPHGPPFCSNELPASCRAPLWRPCGLSLPSHSPQHHGLPWCPTQGGYLVNLGSQGAQKKADDAFRKPSGAIVVLWPPSSAALPGKERASPSRFPFRARAYFLTTLGITAPWPLCGEPTGFWGLKCSHFYALQISEVKLKPPPECFDGFYSFSDYS